MDSDNGGCPAHEKLYEDPVSMDILAHGQRCTRCGAILEHVNAYGSQAAVIAEESIYVPMNVGSSIVTHVRIPLPTTDAHQLAFGHGIIRIENLDGTRVHVHASELPASVVPYIRVASRDRVGGLLVPLRVHERGRVLILTSLPIENHETKTRMVRVAFTRT